MTSSAPGPLFAAVADDFTGGSDLAGMLVAEGVPTLQVLGPRLEHDPTLLDRARGTAAIVVATKSRAETAAAARAASVSAIRSLAGLGARQLYFKYCSTFDSTERGNIGPVTEALLDELGERFTVAVPALPANGRTQYLGHLFVGDELLSESPLRHHPLNPMTDPNLVRHLRRQTTRTVGLVAHPAVRAGAAALRERLSALAASGTAVALVDAVCDEDLAVIAEATSNLRLLTGGSGLPRQMAALWRRRGDLSAAGPIPRPSGGPGAVLLLAGSCSARTLEQIAAFQRAGHPCLALDVRALVQGPDSSAAEIRRLSAALATHLEAGRPVLAFSSATAQERTALLGEARERGVSPDALSMAVEGAMSALARRAADAGVRRFVVAGGETSGAVVEELDVAALEIGAMLDPGVPYCRAVGPTPFELFLKSGNFGAEDFLVRAVRALRGD